MRHLFSIAISITLLFTNCTKDENNNPEDSCDYIEFKYYKDSKDTLGPMKENYIVLGIDTSINDIDIQEFISNIVEFDQDYDYKIHRTSQYKFNEIPLRLNSSYSCGEITQLISNLQETGFVSYVHYAIQTDICNNLIGEPMGDLCIDSYSSSFYVKAQDENDLDDLYRLIEETSTKLVEQNEFESKVFTVRATKDSDGDALKMANYFHKTGLFEYSEPEITKYAVE